MIASGQSTWQKSQHRRKDGTSIPIEDLPPRGAHRTGLDHRRDPARRQRASARRATAKPRTLDRALPCRNRRHFVSAEGGDTRHLRDGRLGVRPLLHGRRKAGVVRFSDAWGIAEPEVQQVIEQSRELVYPSGVGLSGKAWQSGQPQWSANTSDARRSGLLKNAEGNAGLHGGVFAFPVVFQGTTWGYSRLLRARRESRTTDCCGR